jgi:hypothetical protein
VVKTDYDMVDGIQKGYEDSSPSSTASEVIDYLHNLSVDKSQYSYFDVVDGSVWIDDTEAEYKELVLDTEVSKLITYPAVYYLYQFKSR